MTLQKIKEELKKKFISKMEEFWFDDFYDYQDDVEKMIENLLNESYQEWKRDEKEYIENKLSEFEVYDEDPDNCRRMIGEMKYFLNYSIEQQW